MHPEGKNKLHHTQHVKETYFKINYFGEKKQI